MNHAPPPILPRLLPHSLLGAIQRGLRGQCPRCGTAGLFRRWLKPVETCPVCGFDWTLARADDIPPYVAILVTGHLLAPIIILMVFDLALPVAVVGAVIGAIALTLVIALLQPSKGAVMAAQWWLGILGLGRERRPDDEKPAP